MNKTAANRNEWDLTQRKHLPRDVMLTSYMGGGGRDLKSRDKHVEGNEVKSRSRSSRPYPGIRLFS